MTFRELLWVVVMVAVVTVALLVANSILSDDLYERIERLETQLDRMENEDG